MIEIYDIHPIDLHPNFADSLVVTLLKEPCGNCVAVDDNGLELTEKEVRMRLALHLKGERSLILKSNLEEAKE